MRDMQEVKEIEEVNEVKEKSGGAGAFFDLDGTLMAGTSMERRFFRMLRFRREIGAGNYWCWLLEAVRLWPRGIRVMLQANKMYLRGVQSFGRRGGRGGDDRLGHDKAQHPGGHGVVSPHLEARMPVTTFFAEALERVAWHAKEGHAIVLMSGTLEVLAEEAARGLEADLAERGLSTRIRVCATRLEEKDGKWTGKILGEAMFGEAKARAARRLAVEMRLDLGQCFAYGDSGADAWLLTAVGRAFAVNPSKGLARMARTHGWPILDWEEKDNLTQRRRERREVAERKKTAGCDRGMELVRPESHG